MNADVRWQQRLSSFRKALALLREPLLELERNFSDLEKEGIVQRFEITFELAWKTMNDFLAFNGVAARPVSPRAAIKAAFSARIIEDGQLWIEMLDRRNLLTHTYDEKLLDETVQLLRGRYLGAFERLRSMLEQKTHE